MNLYVWTDLDFGDGRGGGGIAFALAVDADHAKLLLIESGATRPEDWNGRRLCSQWYTVHTKPVAFIRRIDP